MADRYVFSDEAGNFDFSRGSGASRYFILGSDLHREDSLQSRLDGLQRARELAGEQQIDELTIANPAKLLPLL